MYCKNASGQADREVISYSEGIVAHVIDFFHTQIALATQAGVRREQLILDPGMGAFVSQDPMDSIHLLQAIPALKQEFGLPIYICTSRKGFLGKLSHDD
jgi:dihydropteroate synthase